MDKLVLHDFHEELGAQFITKYQKQIPDHYGSLIDELHSTLNKLTLIDHSYFGKLRLTGSDALDLLNRISTNDMSQLIVGSVCDTVFATPKGRIIDYVRVIRYDDYLILITRSMDSNLLLEWINRFIFLEDVKVENVSDQYLWFTVMGPEVLRFLRDISGQKLADKDDQLWIKKGDVHFPILLNDNYMVAAYNFCLPAGVNMEVLIWMADELNKFGGCFIGDGAFQVLRIRSGTPAWGSELNERYNPHEARLLNAVSFTKECYTGQEVIARLDTYDKVQRYLMIIHMEEKPEGTPPFEIFYDSEVIGIVTSFVEDPISKKCIGLGYIKKQYSVTELDIQVEVKCTKGMISAHLTIPPVNDPGRLS